MSLALALITAAFAQAVDDEAPLAGQVGLWAGHARTMDPARVNDMAGLTEVGAHGLLLGFDGSRSAGMLDFGLGFGGGFAYHGSVQFGVGGWVGERFALGLTTGVGVGSVYQRVPRAFRVPARASLVVQVLQPVRVEIFAEPSWIPNNNNVRKAGGTTIPFLDEWRAGALFYFGHPVDTDTEDAPTRWGFGVTVDEVMGTRILGARIHSAIVERPRRAEIDFSDYPGLEALLNGSMMGPDGPDGVGLLGEGVQGFGTGGLGLVGAVGEAWTPEPLCASVLRAWSARESGFEGTYPASARFEVPQRERPWWGADAEVAGQPGGLVQVTGEPNGASRWVMLAGSHTGADAGASADAAVLALADAIAACRLPGSWVRDDTTPAGRAAVVLAPFPAEGADPFGIEVRSVDWAAEGGAPERAVLVAVRRASDTPKWNR